jgi:5-formyltetrahydrofolate cyclo-ligase
LELILGPGVFAQHFMKNKNSHRKIKLLKKNIRKEILGKRDTLLPEYRKESSRLISEKFLNTYYYNNSDNILTYCSFGSEVDTNLIIKKALNDKKNIILPRVQGNKLELFFVNDPLKQLEKGTYGIMEPIINLCIPAKTSYIDLVVVPGVSFDTNLNRLGYGSGYFDRIFQDISEKATKIALCFDIQLVDSIPVLDHDVKVDILITESKIYYSK